MECSRRRRRVDWSGLRARADPGEREAEQSHGEEGRSDRERRRRAAREAEDPGGEDGGEDAAGLRGLRGWRREEYSSCLARQEAEEVEGGVRWEAAATAVEKPEEAAEQASDELHGCRRRAVGTRRLRWAGGF